MKILKPRFWDKNYHTFLSIFLFPVSLLYKIAISLRKIIITEKQFSIPIICVGNIYIGGTGKTPISVEIFKILKSLGKSPAFVKKYYSFLEDEIQELKLSGDVFVSKSRIISIENLEKNGNDVAILDDGFQDYTIHKDFNILCFDENLWIGNGMTIPAGPLREPLKSLKKANCVLIKGKKNNDIENKIRSYNSEVEIYYFYFDIENKEKLINKQLVAFSGIGNNENFFENLIKNNLKIKKKFSFPDHYNFKNNDIEKIILAAESLEAQIVTTEKDYFRINDNFKSKITPIKINTVIEEKDKFIENLKKI